MLVVLSPAKNQVEQVLNHDLPLTQPVFKTEIGQLVDQLKTMSDVQIQSLMHVSPKLGALNYARYQSFDQTHYAEDNAYPALGLFAGDAYRALDATTLSPETVVWTQRHLRILSGLYGVLRPLDLIQPYRLEMKTKLATPQHRDLYAFWGHKLTEYLGEQLLNTQSQAIVNLASGEYSQAALTPGHTLPVINVEFKVNQAGTLRTIGIRAKRARGLMTRWIMTQQLTDPDALKGFNLEHYTFAPQHSDDGTYTFIQNTP